MSVLSLVFHYASRDSPGQRLPKRWFRHTLAGSDRHWQPIEIFVSHGINWMIHWSIETYIDIVSRVGTSNIKLSDSNFLRSSTGKSVKSCRRPWANIRVVRDKGYLSRNCCTGTSAQVSLRAYRGVSSHTRGDKMIDILPIPSIGIPAAIHFLTWLTIPFTLE
jgi:hypothetical protein